MLGEVPAPKSTAWEETFLQDLPIKSKNYSKSNLIIICNMNHYDHLDYGSIQKLKGKTKQFMSVLV